MKLRASEMSCEEMVALVTDYLEGSLSARDRRRFRKHLKACEACVEYVGQMELVIETMGVLPEEEIPTPVLDELMVAFRNYRRAERWSSDSAWSPWG